MENKEVRKRRFTNIDYVNLVRTELVNFFLTIRKKK